MAQVRPPQLPGFSIVLDGHVAILAYNRPQTGNSLHPTVINSLYSAMKWAIAEPAVKVIVQTGTGKFFSTGRDMSPDTQNLEIDEGVRLFRELNRLLILCEKVLIAAVNGPAIGYGTTSLALYDLVYSVPEAYFFTPFSKWALCPEGCSTVTFPAIMGHQKAAALLLAGEHVSAEELYTAGLITKIIRAGSNEEFMDAVLNVARRIAGYMPNALKASKAMLDAHRKTVLLKANDEECDCLRELFNGRESKIAVLEFEKEQRAKREARNGSSKL
ncbi:ClpP/crotonase-like domain-containing protein [Talaromyces proteolyticus]|uniref:ClpP/crotonase-like domain-containing protein n=1 Tax=Talaromyces proteolyticus TaxID=1131652 RepID=A0AAD4KK18_9EURO|nr:ClpP/crotonase-like domain-containing protein [Talaromyces proteolyticus]KAH8694036.1 ClpP/crotonase-like domain-containing protein [Talaromyces proteolyticus]